MELGFCPKCSSNKVRTGHVYLLHLARLARGSHRRYCRECKSRWKSDVKAYSPWINLLAVMPIFGILGFLAYQVWLDTRVDMDLASGRDSLSGTAAGRNPDGSFGLQNGSATGPYGRGMRTDGQYWRTWQTMNMNTGYPGGIHMAGAQNSQFDLLGILLQLLKGKTPQELAKELDHTDKQTLWNKYGNNFASKEDAKAAYSDFQHHRDEIPK